MTHLVRSLPGVIIPDAQEAIARQVFGPRRLRPFDPQAGANITVTVNALGAIIASTGGSSTPDDGDLTIAQQAYHPHMPQILTVRAADSSITVTQDALGYLIAATAAAAVDDANNIIANREYNRFIQQFITEFQLLFSDNTLANASASEHGLMQKYTGDTTKFLRADGSFQSVSGSGGGWDDILATAYLLIAQ